MKFFDNHTHSTFSPDSTASVRDSICAAMGKGLMGIAITDHYDVDAPSRDQEFLFNPAEQQQEIAKVEMELWKEIREKDFQIMRGIEVGLQPGSMAKIKEFTGKYSFDTVIASIHFVDGTDPYMGTYYGDKDYKYAFSHTLEIMYETALAYKDFDILGHYDYVARYSPYGHGCRDITMAEFGEWIEPILRFLAQEGKTFEINTKTYKNHKGYIPQLDTAILRRFRELGGEALSLGSDSHNLLRFGDEFEKYAHIAKECGFRWLVYYKGRKPQYYRIEL
ncbi:MAG: histidinol-phosphatase HisJ family protein [Bacteroidales bacterium]|nr:histidinol-phosphatase HisJ family protein [Bacteroidales bacterium]